MEYRFRYKGFMVWISATRFGYWSEAHGGTSGSGWSTEEPGKDPDMALPELQTRGPSRAPPRLIPAPDSPNLPIQLPSSPPLPAQLPPPVSSFGRNCTPSQAPVVDDGQYDHLPYKQLHEQCKQKRYTRGIRRKRQIHARMRRRPTTKSALRPRITTWIPRCLPWVSGGDHPGVSK